MNTLRPLRIRPVEAISKCETPAMINGRVQYVRDDVYPPHPEGEALRQLRLELGLNLRPAAVRIGITGSILSGLENGSFTAEVPEEWDEIRRRMKAVPAEQQSPGAP